LKIVLILCVTPQPIIRGFLHLCNDTVSFDQFTFVDAIVLPKDRFMHRTVGKKNIGAVDIDTFLWCKGYYNEDQDGVKQSEADSATLKEL